MAESTLSADQRLIQLEKQKLRLEQRRKARQLQSDKVTVNTVGLRPGTSKSSRPSTGRSSRNGSTTTISNTTSPEVVDNPSPDVVDYNPSPEPLDQCKEINSTLTNLQDKPSDTHENEVVSDDNTTEQVEIDVVKKLSELGISSTVAYDSDNSHESIDGIELDEEPQFEKPHQQDKQSAAAIAPMSSNVIPNSINVNGATPTVNSTTVSNDIKAQLPNEQFNSDVVDTVSNPLNAIVKDRAVTNLAEVVFRPPPEGVTVKCRITRTKLGMDKFMYPTYNLELEWDGHTNLFLLAAKKKKKSRSSYYTISMDPDNVSKESAGFVAKLRSNFLGTSFVAYDSGSKPITSPSRGIDPSSYNVVREELVAIHYDTNILGFKGPRRMNVVIPSLAKTKERIRVRPSMSSETLLERMKVSNMTNLLQLYNKQPVWSEETQAYVLNFHGRVTEASVKNFQLVHDSDDDYVIVQFGRISEDVFTMDYSFPISAVQAFAVCLSSFDSKLACE